MEKRRFEQDIEGIKEVQESAIEMIEQIADNESMILMIVKDEAGEQSVRGTQSIKLENVETVLLGLDSIKERLEEHYGEIIAKKRLHDLLTENGFID